MAPFERNDCKKFLFDTYCPRTVCTYICSSWLAQLKYTCMLRITHCMIRLQDLMKKSNLLTCDGLNDKPAIIAHKNFGSTPAWIFRWARWLLNQWGLHREVYKCIYMYMCKSTMATTQTHTMYSMSSITNRFLRSRNTRGQYSLNLKCPGRFSL